MPTLSQLEHQARAAFTLADFELASQAFAALAEADPDNPEWHYNAAIAFFEAHQISKATEYCDLGLRLAPGHPAFLGLQGKIGWNSKDQSGSEMMFEAALEAAPYDPQLIHGYADFLRGHGRLKDLNAFIAQLGNGADPDPALIHAYAAICDEFGWVEQAADHYSYLLKDRTLGSAARSALFKLYVEQGGEANAVKLYSYDTWASEHFDVLDGLDALIAVGAYGEAQALLKAAHDTSTKTIVRECRILALNGQVDQARVRLFEVLPSLSNGSDTAELAIEAAKCALSCGIPEDARSALDLVPVDERDQEYWAFLGTTWEMLGETDQAAWLWGYDSLIGIQTLICPEPWHSLSNFLEDLSQSLLLRHRGHHAPADQTLRQGTQSKGHLFDSADPVLRAYQRAVHLTVSDHLASICRDDTHPFRSRITEKFKIGGAWSVSLKRSGHHISHVHPDGWLSSAAYIRLDDGVVGSSEEHPTGWLRLGAPDLYERAPVLDFSKLVKPEAGELVLFPSYCWHGTLPTSGNGIRLTAPFDILPI